MTTAEYFAGFGGFRAATEANDIHTVRSGELDPYARKAYEAFWGEAPQGMDVRDEDPNEVPAHDIMTGGFPCQSFSIAGVSKMNSLGRPHGFKDVTRGTLFFELCRLLDAKRPQAFIFENVKNLTRHDGGQTFEVVMKSLEGIGYNVAAEVVDASDWLPQKRERVYIVGFRDDHDAAEVFPMMQRPERPVCLSEILEDEVGDEFTLWDRTWEYLQQHKLEHAAKGHGFGYTVIEPPFEGKVTRTLVRRYHKDGSGILIAQEGKNPRKLTPVECMRLQGFPAEQCEGTIRNGVLSNTRWYMGFGNAIAVPPIAELVRCVKEVLESWSSLQGPPK